MEIEKTTITSLMWCSPGQFLEETQGLSAECFTSPLCRHIYEVIYDRALAGKALNDMVMLTEELHQRGHSDITVPDIITLTTQAQMTVNIRDYVVTIIDRHRRRQVEKTLGGVLLSVKDPSAPLEQTITQAVNALVGNGGLSNEETIRLTDVLALLQTRIDNNVKGLSPSGFPTGFSRIDQYGGLHPQDLVIVAGASSSGKTSLALNILVNAVRNTSLSALVFSMEMSALQIGARIMSPEVQAPSSVILYRTFRERGLFVISEAMETLRTFSDRLFIGDGSIQTIEAILGSIRLHHARYGVRLVMIDYLQIVGLSHHRSMTREDALADGARRLKNIAKELDICVVLLSQINREGLSSGNPEPTAAQLRGSGQINEAADMTLLVYRPEVHGHNYRSPFTEVDTHGTAMLKIDKDRNGAYGGIGQWIVKFDGPTTKFVE